MMILPSRVVVYPSLGLNYLFFCVFLLVMLREVASFMPFLVFFLLL